jgi:hypothetical protein
MRECVVVTREQKNIPLYGDRHQRLSESLAVISLQTTPGSSSARSMTRIAIARIANYVNVRAGVAEIAAGSVS